MLSRHNRLLVTLYLASDALIGVSAFVLAYAARFHTGAHSDHEGHSAAQPVHQRPAVHRRASCRSGFISRASIGCAAGGRASTISSASSSARSSPSCSASSSTLYTQTYFAGATAKDAGAFEVSQAGLGDLPRDQRGAHLRVARSRPRGARTAVARRHRSQAHPDRRFRRTRPSGRRQDSRAPRARLPDRRLRGRQAGRRPSRLPRAAAPRHASTRPPKSPPAKAIDHLYVALPPEQHVADAAAHREHEPRIRRRQGGARPAAGHRAARPARGSRRRSGHQHQRRPAPGLQRHRQARDRHRHLGGRRCWCSRIPLAHRRAARPAHVTRAGVLPPGADGPRRQVVHDREVPLDVRRRRSRHRTGVGAPERPARDAARPVPAPIEPRRAAAAVERAAGRHVDCRSAARAAALRRSSSSTRSRSTCCATR